MGAMKNPKLLFALIVFLLAYGVLLTLYSIGIERRLSRLESSYKELEWRYRIDSNTLAHVRMTPELIKSLEAALVDEQRRLRSTNRDLRPLGTEFNSPPAHVSSR
jgi:hypothetical protein